MSTLLVHCAASKLGAGATKKQTSEGALNAIEKSEKSLSESGGTVQLPRSGSLDFMAAAASAKVSRLISLSPAFIQQPLLLR